MPQRFVGLQIYPKEGAAVDWVGGELLWWLVEELSRRLVEVWKNHVVKDLITEHILKKGGGRWKEDWGVGEVLLNM